MKAKYSIWIFAAAVSFTALRGAEPGIPQTYIGGQGNTIVNNYYIDDFGYHYSSRINRFHRSYTAFEYYSPVFTETYWYNYEPYTWGLTIYSGGGFGIRYGYSWSYPAFYGYGWNTPVFSNSYYWGYDPYWDYDPFFYNPFTPVVIKVKIRNYYPGYRTRYYSHWGYRNNVTVINNYNNHYYYGNNFGSSYNSGRFNYPSSPYPSANQASVSRRNVSSNVSNTGSVPSRRESVSGITTGNSVGASQTGRAQTGTTVDQAGRRTSTGTVTTNRNSSTVTNSDNRRNVSVNPPVQTRTQTGTVSSGSSRSSTIANPPVQNRNQGNTVSSGTSRTVTRQNTTVNSGAGRSTTVNPPVQNRSQNSSVSSGTNRSVSRQSTTVNSGSNRGSSGNAGTVRNTTTSSGRSTGTVKSSSSGDRRTTTTVKKSDTGSGNTSTDSRRQKKDVVE